MFTWDFSSLLIKCKQVVLYSRWRDLHLEQANNGLHCHIWEWPCVYQGNVQKVCYSEYVLQGDRKPAGSTSNTVKAGRTVMIRDLFLIFCSLLSKMGSVYTIQHVRWYDFAYTVCQSWLLTFWNGKCCASAYLHHFYLFFFVFVNLLTCHLFHRKTLCYGLLSSSNLSCAVIGMPFYL